MACALLEFALLVTLIGRFVYKQLLTRQEKASFFQEKAEILKLKSINCV